LDDLRLSIARGRYPWFQDEFAAAVRTAAFTRPDWEATVGPADRRVTGGQADLVRAEQRIVWSHVLSGHAFPATRRRSREAQSSNR
jgi:hypothetical protein